ncbi:MAG: hypothetical protein A2Y40_01550 [Candidatus Margulisbacteria bacterium GWF2_35_9]|nr:MAG: hypothetical protein A2Y40_01550 [Candidatus Margulisbacteria bacterium GWF2_35_9]
MVDKINKIRPILILLIIYISTGVFLIYQGYNLLLFHFLLSILLVFILLISLILLAVKKYRKLAFKIVSIIITIYFCIAILQLFSWHIRKLSFSKLASRSEVLISAINKYEEATGKAPESLNNLVPDYISRIPKTGILNYPKIEYSNYERRWNLFVETPRGPLNWDLFIYFSDQIYPDYMFGGFVEKIGKWAYIHE